MENSVKIKAKNPKNKLNLLHSIRMGFQPAFCTAESGKGLLIPHFRQGWFPLCGLVDFRIMMYGMC